MMLPANLDTTVPAAGVARRAGWRRYLTPRFGLRAVLLVQLAIALVMGAVLFWKGPERAAQALRRRGAEVSFDNREVSFTGHSLSAGDIDLVHKLGVEKLNLSNCQLEAGAAQRLRMLVKLQRASIDNSPIGDDGVSALLSHDTLSGLAIGKVNCSSDSLGRGLSGSKQLENLSISDISGKRLSLRDMPRLKTLSLDSCSVDELSLGQLPKVVEFTVARATGDYVHWVTIEDMPRLERLTILGQQLDRLTLSRVPALRALNLHLTELSAVGLHEFVGRLDSLTSLESVSAIFGDTNDEALTALATLPALRTLGLRVDTSHTEEMWNQLSQMANLRVLVIDGHGPGVGPSDEALRNLARCQTLEALSLVDRRFDDRTVAALAGLPNLRTLDLCGSSVSDESVAVLEKMKQLTQLRVGIDRISWGGRARLRQALGERVIDGP